VSDDGALSIVVIALLGNPFSPGYARARRRRQGARALDFCALNVAVYGPRGRRWALHERSVRDADRDARSVGIGGSRVSWVGDVLVIDLDERTLPWARPLRGRVIYRPASAPSAAFSLDGSGLHTWWPVAPEGRIDVSLDEPGVRFSGHGYHDANAGDAPLETTFARWTWSRARMGDGRTGIAYDVIERSGDRRLIALDLDARRGALTPMADPCPAPLPITRWRIQREAHGDASSSPRVLRELEDTPFYARALVETRLQGRNAVAMHETLSLDRFARSWVQFLLQFRMRRRGSARSSPCSTRSVRLGSL
jgi:carotenoid 1,2-hydratase